ncbi:MAG: hypothetical protein HYV37_02500 [Candidatus Levyibacteriota bacterium]|nr:MAG: hypothetical protein HYV37_02500 [Candidatus Levybacteria bacterium]
MSGAIQKQGLSRNVIRFLALSPIILLILGDALLFQQNSDWRTFPILIFYIFLIIRYKIAANTTFLICLALFLFMYIHYIFSDPKVFATRYPLAPFGEKMAEWLYLFLVIGVIQKWQE